MDFDVPLATRPFAGTVQVPASKSLLQRALVLAALCDEPVSIDESAFAHAGEDVRRTQAALASLGAWHAGGLGDRESRHCDLGFGATGFRCLSAVACLRPPGARTLVTGRPELLRRPHRPLRRALGALGARIVRRQSGAFRVVSAPMAVDATLRVDATTSSQYLTALALVAPRIGGLTLELVGDQPVSQPYLALTAATLAAFGIENALDVAGARTFRIEAGTPRRDGPVAIEPDASAAAAWYCAAALVGGAQVVAGLHADSPQADTQIWDVLTRMGALVDRQHASGVRVVGTGERLAALGEIDLRHATDMLPLVAVLAATADGESLLVGAGHTRRKESDRLARVAAGIEALGGVAVLDAEDRLRIRGTDRLAGTVIDVRDDHRLAFAFGVLGLRVPGIRLRGAESTRKSDPLFLAGLSQFVTAG